jgi:DNA-binding Xre family transcriptional regulator
MKNLPKTVAKNIKRLLADRSKTAEKLAFEIEMSKSFLYDFLAGNKDMTLHNLQRVAEGLEVTVEELIKE